MRTSILLLLTGLALPAGAQTPGAGARAAALAGASVALPDDGWGEINVASWARGPRPSISLLGAQLYGLSELRLASTLLLLPVAGGSAGFAVRTFGFELYRESSLSIGYARAFRPGTHREVYAGVRVRWHVIRIPGYGHSSVPALSAGIILPVTPALALGAAAENLAAPTGPLREALPRSLTIGAGCFFTPRLAVLADVTKEVRSPSEVRIGIEAAPVSALAVRAGITIDPPRAAGGIGIRTRHLVTDFAAERHDALGWSPSLSVRIEW